MDGGVVHGGVEEGGCVELVRFVSPGGPAGARLSGEEFEVWPRDEAFDAGVRLVRFAGVFADGGGYDLAYIGMEALGVSACGEEAGFGVGACPVSEAEFWLAGVFGEDFDVGEGFGLVGEAPGVDYLQGLGEERPRSPQEEGAIIGCEVGNREGRDITNGHS